VPGLIKLAQLSASQHKSLEYLSCPGVIQAGQKMKKLFREGGRYPESRGTRCGGDYITRSTICGDGFNQFGEYRFGIDVINLAGASRVMSSTMVFQHEFADIGF